MFNFRDHRNGAPHFVVRTITSTLFFAVILVGGLRSEAQTLYGVEWDTGNLYRVSTANASLSLVGNTGLGLAGALEFSPDGRLFAFTSGNSPALYQVDPNTAASTLIGPLNIGFVFEGGLAFASDGTAYGVNQGDAGTPSLFTINLNTGQATIVAALSGGNRDVNGLGWRSDGKLVGIDRASNSLILIDPATAAVSAFMPLAPAVGAAGGMSVVNDQGYFSTAGPGAGIPGSNELYAFNALTGAYSLVGTFGATITGTGISGLALTPIPEPSTAVLGTISLISWATFVRRRKHSQ